MFIEQVVGSETRVKILRTLLHEGLPQLELRALSRETGRSVSGVHKALKGLQAARVITSHARGRTTYFAVDGAAPSYEQLLELFREERNRQNVPHLFPTLWNHLESAVSRMTKSSGVRFVLLYGSMTRPPIYPDADVDLLIGVEPGMGFHPVAGQLIGHRISPLMMDTDAFERKMVTKDRFITSVLERHVTLYAAPDYDPPWERNLAAAATTRRRRRKGRMR